MLHGCNLACRALAQAEKKLEDGELKQEHKAAPAIQGQDNTDRTPEQLEHEEEEPPQVHLCASAEPSEDTPQHDQQMQKHCLCLALPMPLSSWRMQCNRKSFGRWGTSVACPWPQDPQPEIG